MDEQFTVRNVSITPKRGTLLVSILTILITIIALLILIVIFMPYRNYILGGIIQNITYADYTVEELSYEEMKEDLDYAIDCITSTNYYWDDMSNVYGYTLEDKREHYYELLEKCENNADFYILLSLVMSECGSPHAGMLYCNSSAYTSMYTLNSDILNLMANNGGVADGWYDYLSDTVSEYNAKLYESNPFYTFVYYGSEYVSSKQTSLDYCYITAINGDEPSEFVKSYDTTSQTSYDFIANRLYKSYLYFLKEPSENTIEVTLTVKYIDGSSEDITCYYDFFEAGRYLLASNYIGEIGADYDVYEGTDEISEDEFIIDIEESTSTVYIKLDSFEYKNGDSLKESILEVADMDNIIIDVRSNPGGFVGFWESYVYGALFSEDMENVSTSYIEIGEYYVNIFYGLRATCMEYSSIEKETSSALPIATTSTNKWFIITQTQAAEGSYVGENENRRIAILTDNDTCSCADDFVDYFKENNLATIYGTNTAGEGTCVTTAEWRLPNSLLIFNVGYGIMLNSDGQSSSIYGTSPDVYVSVDIDLFEESRVNRDNGNDMYSIESLKAYDTVFIAAYSENS